MFVPEKMKCNRLVQVVIPKGHDMYSRASGLVLPPASEYTGEVLASRQVNKLDELADFDRFDNMRQREELSKEKPGEPSDSE